MTLQNSSGLLTIIQQVGKESEKGGFQPNAFKSQLKPLSDYLQCSNLQAYLFSLIMNLSLNGSDPNMKEIAEHLGISPIEILRVYPEIRDLLKKKIIKKSGRKNYSHAEYLFSVPNSVVDCLLSEKKIITNVREVNDNISFIIAIKQILEEFKDDEYTTDEFMEEISNQFLNNSDLSIVKNIRLKRLDRSESIVLFGVISELMDGRDQADLNDILSDYFNNPRERHHLKRAIIKGNSNLIKSRILTLEDGTFRSERTIMISEFGLDYLFGNESDLFLCKNFVSDKNLTQPESLQKRILYYNPQEQKEISFLEKTLYKSNYTKVIKKLDQYNLNSGITILFHGAPGVGKTETVYQLARKAGRSIFRVDISDTKSMWFGESEKKIKGIFDRYKKMVEKSEHAPILLFNEADGILSRRKSNGNSNTDQTENAIQNIILQELEEMKGIFIATTNLTQNLDKAFERRFLYKVCFEKPGINVRKKIWKDNLKELNTKDLDFLARNFEFTGGQIVNVSRKYFMRKILNAEPVDLNSIRILCKQETLDSQGQRCLLGFKTNYSPQRLVS